MRELRWQHRGWFARRWDLTEGDHVVATLTQRGWGFNADLEHAGRRHTLDVTGFLRWALNVRDEQGIVLASMKVGWRGQGVAEVANGQRFRWDGENWWGTRWSLEDAERGARVASVHMDAFFRMNARAEVDEAVAPPDDVLVPLLALTWLAVVITAQAASSAGAG